ncbi:hypothetical protein ACM43_11830 [Bradyrhizobium sp. CCBAU 45321]|nr:hypothetical protein [Bradyrhizobium sp. CCBAU 45321]
MPPLGGVLFSKAGVSPRPRSENWPIEFNILFFIMELGFYVPRAKGDPAGHSTSDAASNSSDH